MCLNFHSSFRNFTFIDQTTCCCFITTPEKGMGIKTVINAVVNYVWQMIHVTMEIMSYAFGL